MRYLKASLIALALALIVPLLCPPQAEAVTYNGVAAATYADRYACNGSSCFNHRYKYLTNDCTNFVSQALDAGGFTPYTLWKPYTHQWAYVTSLYALFKGNNWLTVGTEYKGSGLSANYTSALRGDIYMYDWGKGDHGFSHMAIEAGWGARTEGGASGDYVDQHSTDRYHAAWNFGYLHPTSSIDRARMRVWVLHIHG